MEHAHTTHAGEAHGSLRSYLIGFVMAVILTVVPFAMVMKGGFSTETTVVTVVVLAVVQMLVHLIYFLHMDSSSDQRWNVLAFVFTGVIIGIVAGGTLWVMYNMNVNMMVM
jgi:cytochrome o ubiquinol oxidase operon protein cyoD